ncbi:MAG: HNH endonuclease family protein [Acidimicrobiia bacterium]
MTGLLGAVLALWVVFSPAPGADPVDGLRIAPEGPRTGYSRSLFPHWVDDDGDGCSTREEVLVAESEVPAGTDPASCRVLSGHWVSAYDGIGTDDPADLEIDHVVALAEAWDSGAAAWDTPRRRAFANDLDEPLALIAVTSAANGSKSDQDPAQWRPPRPEAWCGFARDWVRVKVRWDLTADETEAGALRDMLASC